MAAAMISLDGQYIRSNGHFVNMRMHSLNTMYEVEPRIVGRARNIATGLSVLRSWFQLVILSDAMTNRASSSAEK